MSSRQCLRGGHAQNMRVIMCHRQPESPDSADSQPISSGPRPSDPGLLLSFWSQAQQSTSAAFALVNQIHVGYFEFGPNASHPRMMLCVWSEGLTSTFAAFTLVPGPQVDVCCVHFGPRPSTSAAFTLMSSCQGLWSITEHRQPPLLRTSVSIGAIFTGLITGAYSMLHLNE